MSLDPDNNSTPSEPAAAKTGKVRSGCLVRLLLVFAVIVALLTLAGWLIIRSDRLNDFISGQIRNKLKEYGLRGEIGGFGLSLSDQTASLKDFRIYNDSNGKLLATIGSVKISFNINEPFAPRLSREIDVRVAEIDGLKVNLEIDRGGRSSFDGLRSPPSKPGALKFNTSKLRGLLTDAAVRFTDRRNDLEFELDGIGATAAPDGTRTGEIAIRLASSGGKIARDGRSSRIEKFETNLHASGAGATIDELSFDAGFARLGLKGEVSDWSAVSYGFDFDASVDAGETTRIFSPAVEISGRAIARGRIDGTKSEYRFKADVDSPDLNVYGAKLKNVSFSRLAGSGSGDRLDFTCSRLSAGSTVIDRITIGPVSIGEYRGELRDVILRTRAPSAQVATVEWPESKLSDLKLSGLEVDLDFHPGRFNYDIRTDADLASGEITEVSFTHALARARFDKAGLDLTEIQADVLGGKASGNFKLPLGRGAVSTATASYSDLQASELIALVKKLSGDQTGTPVPLGGTVNGQAEISFAGADPRTLNGRIEAHFTGSTGDSLDSVPLNGDASVEVSDGVFRFRNTEFTTGPTKFGVDGYLAVIGDTELGLKVSSSQAEQLVQIARSIEPARPYIVEYEPQLIGNFSFNGTIRGRTVENGPGEESAVTRDISIEGDIDAETAGLRDALLGSLKGRLFVSNERIRVSGGQVLSPGGGSLKFDLDTPFDPKSTAGWIDAVIDRIELDTLLAASGAPDAGKVVTGEIAGEVHLSGLPGEFHGTSNVRLVNGTIAGRPAELASADVRFEGKTATLNELIVRISESSLNVSGSMNLEDYAFRVSGRAAAVALNEIVREMTQEGEEPPVRVEGTADADFSVSGRVIPGKQPDIDRENLRITLTARGRNLFINGRDAGKTALTISTTNGGRVEFSVTSDLLLAVKPPDEAAHPEIVRGWIELRSPGIPLNLDAELVNQELTPLLELLAPDAKEIVTGKVNGRLRMEGPTQGPDGAATLDLMRGSLTLTEASLMVSGTPVTVNTPVTAGFESMQISIQPMRLTGEGIDLSIGGVVGLKGDAGMNFSFKGMVNLASLPLTDTDLSLVGTVTFDASLSGSSENPVLGGSVDLAGLGLSSGEIPFFITDGNGRIALNKDRLILREFNAGINEGTLKASGTMTLDRLRPKEWNYNIQAENATLNFRDVSATVIGDLRLSGDPSGQTLAGTIAIPDAQYAPDIDLDNLLTSGAEISLLGFGLSDPSPGISALPAIRLNLRVEANNSLIVHNEQIDAVGSTLLNVSGTLTNPNLTGRIESEAGSVRFRGQRYEITRGTIELPPGDAPALLNLTAEGEFSGFRVTIGFIGPIDDIDLTLVSEPQLSRDEIIGLITTGRTESGTLTTDPLRTGVGTAASLLSSGIISRPTEQLLGISRFQIDPVIRANANPAARLTVGQQISRNVYLSYSTNLATEQDQTALAEYTISNRFSALASYIQGGSSARQGLRENAFTIELRGRKRFSVGFSQDTVAASTGGAPVGPPDQMSIFSRPTRPAADVEVSPVQDLKLSAKKLGELIPVINQGFSRSLAMLGEQRLREYLQENGYFFAEVGYRCEPVTCSGDNLKLIYDIRPNAIYELKEIRIDGTDLIRLSAIEDRLQSKTASRFGGIPFLKDLPLIGGYVRGLTSNDRLRNDSEMIRRTLVDIGYRNAEVRPRLAVKPENDELIIVFDVSAGAQTEVAGIMLRGNSLITSDELSDAVPVSEGEAFSFSRALAGVRSIREIYNDLGYLEATAELEIENLSDDAVQLIYTISEGQRAYIGEIEINGLTKTGKGWVRRYLDFKQGEVLTPARIRQTQRDLYSTNAFREISIRNEPIGNGAQRISVNLTEAKPLLLVYGLGYSTDDGVRGLMEIANTNLGGSLDALSLRLRGSRREQFAQLSFTDLRPFGTLFPTTMSVFYNRNNNLVPIIRRRLVDGREENVNDQSFGLNRFAAFIQTERKLSARTSVRLRYNYERASLFNLENIPETDITRNERVIRLGMFSLGFTRDSRDSVLNPTRGQLVSLDHSVAADVFGGNESFNKFFGTYQRYHTLAGNFPLLGGSTLAFSGRVGLASVFRDADRNGDGLISESEERLPISERFFSGGATTLRGFRFETAGPMEVLAPRPDKPGELPTLIPLGGDALAIFNFELRYPISERWRVVPFYDLGNVFRRVSDFNYRNMTHTVGIGVRINTPIGPVGVDYGFLLDPPTFPFGDATLRLPRGAFHIRLGQTF